MDNTIHYQPRMSKELQLLQLLKPRKHFTTEETRRYESLYRGYLGEMKFYHLVTSTSTSGYFLFDFLFSSNGTEFQIDSISIEENVLTMYEIKNFSGDFFMDQDLWYSASSKKEVRNPFHQLQRSEFLLRHLLKDTYPNLSIKAYIVFVNDGFMLYQSPLSLPAIFPTQLTRFLKSISGPKNVLSKRVENIANHLASLHIPKSTYEKLPSYSYDELKKGITCDVTCGGFLKKHSNRFLLCPKCQKTVPMQQAIYQNIIEFHTLFPEREIRTGSIYEWCGGAVSKFMIRQVLITYFSPIKKGKFTHYISQ